jgi:hypothetical protein
MNGIELHDLLAVVRWPGGFGNVGVGVMVFMGAPLCQERGSLSQRYFDLQPRHSTSF